MSLSARLSRIEANEAHKTQKHELVALDEPDAERLFEEILLSCRPGLCSIKVKHADGIVEWSGQIQSHEEMLELLC